MRFDFPLLPCDGRATLRWRRGTLGMFLFRFFNADLLFFRFREPFLREIAVLVRDARVIFVAVNCRPLQVCFLSFFHCANISFLLPSVLDGGRLRACPLSDLCSLGTGEITAIGVSSVLKPAVCVSAGSGGSDASNASFFMSMPAFGPLLSWDGGGHRYRCIPRPKTRSLRVCGIQGRSDVSDTSAFYEHLPFQVSEDLRI